MCYKQITVNPRMIYKYILVLFIFLNFTGCGKNQFILNTDVFSRDIFYSEGYYYVKKDENETIKLVVTHLQNGRRRYCDIDAIESSDLGIIAIALSDYIDLPLNFGKVTTKYYILFVSKTGIKHSEVPSRITKLKWHSKNSVWVDLYKMEPIIVKIP